MVMALVETARADSKAAFKKLEPSMVGEPVFAVLVW